MANAQGGQFDKLKVNSTLQVPFYSTLPGSGLSREMVFDYNGADSGLYFRSYDGTRWIKFPVNGGNSNWTLNGNAGTNPSTNFIGTTDNQDFVIKRNNKSYLNLRSDKAIIGEDASLTWINSNPPVNAAWQNVAFGNGLFVGVAQNKIITSPNGYFWTERASPSNRNWSAITYGNNTFVLIASNDGSSTGQVATSPDGVIWTLRNSSVSNNWKSVVFGNGVFVAISTNGANRVMTSPDGINWTTRAVTAASAWQDITFGNGLFVAVSSNDALSSQRIMTSSDGITWTYRTGCDCNYNSVEFGNGIFVISGYEFTSPFYTLLTSTDGITWTPRTISGGVTFSGYPYVSFGNNKFLILANGSTTKVFSSTDAINWVQELRSPQNALEYVNLAFGNNLFVSLSTDGTNRSAVSSSNIGVGIGTSFPNSSSILDLSTISKGLLIPRMTAAQRLSIPEPATALRVYDLDSARDMVNTPTGWKGIRYTSDAIPAASLDTLTSTLSGNLTLTVASTWYDIGSVTLPSGTWILMGQASYTGGAIDGLRIHDGTTTFSTANILTPNIGSREASLSVYRFVSPTTTTTYKLQGSSTTAGALVVPTITINSLGNGTHFSAVKIK